VNGNFAGKRIHINEADWKTPFAISITENIDWEREQQTAVVRVEDKAGQGGIWRPVMLAVRKKANNAEVPGSNK